MLAGEIYIFDSIWFDKSVNWEASQGFMLQTVAVHFYFFSTCSAEHSLPVNRYNDLYTALYIRDIFICVGLRKHGIFLLPTLYPKLLRYGAGSMLFKVYFSDQEREK